MTAADKTEHSIRFMTHAFARRVLANPEWFTCVTLAEHLSERRRGRAVFGVKTYDVARWVHAQYLPEDIGGPLGPLLKEGVPIGTSFELRRAGLHDRRKAMADRLLAAPNRRVTITYTR